MKLSLLFLVIEKNITIYAFDVKIKMVVDGKRLYLSKENIPTKFEL